jgi:hypothetical protein
MLRPALLALCLAQPGWADDMNLPEGWPPKMGDVTGTLGDTAKHWETFDFSIGAFDASAWVGAGYETPLMTLHLMAYPPGEPDRMPGRFHATADYGDALRSGEGAKVHVAILRDEDIDGPRLSSEGQPARLVIDAIGPARENSYNRRITGRIEARLCPVDWPGEVCQDLALTFDTDMQLETTVVVAD